MNIHRIVHKSVVHHPLKDVFFISCSMNNVQSPFMSLICFGYSLALELKVFHLYAYEILPVALVSIKHLDRAKKIYICVVPVTRPTLLVGRPNVRLKRFYFPPHSQMCKWTILYAIEWPLLIISSYCRNFQ